MNTGYYFVLLKITKLSITMLEPTKYINNISAALGHCRRRRARLRSFFRRHSDRQALVRQIPQRLLPDGLVGVSLRACFLGEAI